MDLALLKSASGLFDTGGGVFGMRGVIPDFEPKGFGTEGRLSKKVIFLLVSAAFTWYPVVPDWGDTKASEPLRKKANVIASTFILNVLQTTIAMVFLNLIQSQ